MKVYLDPLMFRDIIIEIVAKAGGDLQSLAKYLVSSDSHMSDNIQRYGETFWEILIAGCLLGGYYE